MVIIWLGASKTEKTGNMSTDGKHCSRDGCKIKYLCSHLFHEADDGVLQLLFVRV